VKKAILFSCVLLLAICWLVEATTIDNNGHTTEPLWKTLGKDFKRTGLSDYPGPEIGCVKWKFETNSPISTSVTVGADNRVHIACEDGKLYTLDINGNFLWSYDANSPLLSAPTIGPDGTIYVGGQDGKLYAIDTNGNLQWAYTTGGLVYSSPAISEDGNIYFCSQDGTLYALTTDGSELWRFETSGTGRLSGSILASPAIGDDGTVYIGGLYDPNLYALDGQTGSVKWQCHFESRGWPFTSPVIGDNGIIYQTLLYDTKLYAIKPENGTIIWSVNLADPNIFIDPNYINKYPDADGWSEPALGPDGTIYVSFDDPYLRAVNPDGSIKWVWVTPLGMAGGYTLAVGSNGLIYAASDDGYLYVVDKNGQMISWFMVDGWLSYPVIAQDNTIIVSDSRDNSMLISHPNNAVWAITSVGCEGRELVLDKPRRR
jgi:outer membrane protein assembly factor BamB